MKISVIVPVYNVAPYLRRALDSLSNQIHRDWEAICVDDGSTDGSGAILDEYAARDNRFRVMHRPNAGVSAARNAGLDAVRGEYVTFLDSDDALHSDWFSNANRILSEHPVDLLRCRFVRFQTDDEVMTLPSSGECGHAFIEDFQSVQRWGWRTFAQGGWIWLCFLRRGVIPSSLRYEVGFSAEEDKMFALRLLPFVRTACQSEFSGYYYRSRSDSLVCVKRTTADNLQIFRQLRNRWKDVLQNQALDDATKAEARHCINQLILREFDLVIRYYPVKPLFVLTAPVFELRSLGLLASGDCPRGCQTALFVFRLTGSLIGFRVLRSIRYRFRAVQERWKSRR